MIRDQDQGVPKQYGQPFQAWLLQLVFWRTELSICVFQFDWNSTTNKNGDKYVMLKLHVLLHNK